MAYYAIQFMVKRIPEQNYHTEAFWCSSKANERQVIRDLTKDKNVVDFYKI